MSKDKNRGLGAGVDALFSITPAQGKAEPGVAPSVFVCPIEKITPQRGQPRQYFDDEKLSALTESIREHGLLEPIVVRKAQSGADLFEIIAGERRWRAAQRAGLHEVHVVVKDVSTTQAFELALIENIIREDLNPIEVAEAYERLLKEHEFTHEKLSQLVKRDRSTITNSLRLLRLPPRVRVMVLDGRLTEGHARTILGANDESQIEAIADEVLRRGLSVRATEALVRKMKGPDKADKEPEPPRSANVRALEEELSRTMGTRVALRDKKGKGEIVISYASLDELDRILGQLR